MSESCYFASSENSGMAEGGANGQLPIWFGDLTIVTFITFVALEYKSITRRRLFQAVTNNIGKTTMVKKSCSIKDLDITSEATPETTGFFEVTIDGKLVHSKKDGDGFPNTKEKIDKIAKAIEATK
ncbi:unnamed protein product [Rotaria magnacalcarata]|uniref:Selenoprotein W n=1 Tax=Rotaria magnacalcarata TaxID=392030 RepID=A0A816PCZ1_9BILA|nr:unnamed protein product [Rotaria magnacalcarata]CAF2047180.1 unnamed protein product [Rotaria magnacalcarata]